MPEHSLKPLPPDIDLETNVILKQLVRSHKALAKLKGFADTIPNKNILINAVTINEAKDSSKIENIITNKNRRLAGFP
jgi:Fic family protein